MKELRVLKDLTTHDPQPIQRFGPGCCVPRSSVCTGVAVDVREGRAGYVPVLREPWWAITSHTQIELDIGRAFCASTRNPKPETRQHLDYVQPETRNPKPETRQHLDYVQPETRNPKPETRNHEPDKVTLLNPIKRLDGMLRERSDDINPELQTTATLNSNPHTPD